ncbi:MAG TPA: arginine deiminase family protein [Bryobacteraceae bacterium]|nr:arginine deiminase family protein [Bryobacteraceae bacterium]
MAITRGVSAALARCALEYQPRIPIDIATAAAQHRDYELVLERCGLPVTSLPAHPEFPDGLFVEDPAIVLDEIAVICRMGAASRRGEGESLAEALRPFRKLESIREPATIEGGDVMRLGKTLFCGISRRTNREGARQLASMVEPFGYTVIPVEVSGCLHLKSAICPVADDTVLLNRRSIGVEAFGGLKMLDIAGEEAGAANVLRIGGKIIMPASFPRTREMLERAGFEVMTVDISELQKAEAGVTCSSLIFKVA